MPQLESTSAARLPTPSTLGRAPVRAGRLHADELLDAQLRRTLGSAPEGGAELGECLQVAHTVRRHDLGAWYTAWTAVGDRARRLAETADDDETARAGFLRAANAYRTAGVMQYGPATHQRLLAGHLRQRETFAQAFGLLDQPAERLSIPFAGTTLPGWFMRPAARDGARATVLLTGGYDSPCEELYLQTGAAALRRGYNVVLFDGPGQGAALLEQGLTLRPDWEAVVAAVIDHVEQRAEVDSTRIALIGLSLGAHLAPRAAGAEPRLAALVADCGAFDLHEAFLARLPGPLADGLRRDKPWARTAASATFAGLARRPTAGWALRRGMLVHGAASPLEYLDALRGFTLADHAERITCPTWVGNAEADEISASAPELVARLRCPHTFVTFTVADGAGDHCEAGARSVYHAASFGWLDGLLAPRAGLPAGG